jgi:glycosyltransferase involved in cell wall biosynthesis
MIIDTRILEATRHFRERQLHGLEMKALCFSRSLSSNAQMAYIRLNAPYERAGIQIINGLTPQLSIQDAIQKIDFVLFQRGLPINSTKFQEIVALARQNEKPIVYEIDDLLFFLPETHPDYGNDNYALSLLLMFQALIEADVVTTSSTKLKQVLGDFNSNIHLLHNFYDDNLWDFHPPIRKNHDTDVLTIGFMGTTSHQPDLKYILPVLLNLLERYNQKIKLNFWGAKPPSELLCRPQVQWKSQNFYSYTEFAKYFQTQSADIFIAPLVSNLFNQCKSFIKFFEYSALGTPGIYSRLDPYEEVITHRENGLLASSLNEWQECLVELIENDDYRHQLAVNAQSSIKDKWLLSKNAYRWRNVFEQIDTDKEFKKISPPLQRFIQSLNNQQEIAISNLQNQIEQLVHSPRHLVKTLFFGTLYKIRSLSPFFSKSP